MNEANIINEPNNMNDSNNINKPNNEIHQEPSLQGQGVESVGSTDLVSETALPKTEVQKSALTEGLAPITSLSSTNLDKPKTRLSGAQKRRLKKARKTAAGLWTPEKPSKTLNITSEETSSIAVNAPGMSTQISEPVEIKRSRWNTLSECTLTEPQSQSYRSTRQTVPNNATAEGYRMAVIPARYPDTQLNQAQAELVQYKILEAVDNAAVAPQFFGAKFIAGVLWIHCANDVTKHWLVELVERLPALWEGARLMTVSSKDLPRRPKVLVWIPDARVTIDVVKARLSRQNAGLMTAEWHLMSRRRAANGQTFAFSIDQKSFDALTTLKFTAFWGLGRVTFQNLKGEKLTTDA
uniref:DUF4780 domain-containing protein n=1 Tax=Lygus hesperus TaxID=30085 RepID=A0A146LAN8_LYGHE